MGTHGWKVRAEYAELRGEVTDFGFSGGLFGDKDWLLFVKPAPGYERLLENFVGHRNASGVVECEIEPPDRIAGQDAETAGVAAKYFAPLMGQQVAVRGVWVTDCSHTWDNRDPVFPVCDDGRTEIHPIYAIEVEHPSSGTGVRRVEVFVFSDSSGGTKPPHAGESIKETFRFVVPGPATSTRPRLRFVSETDMARSRRISLLRGGGETTLEVTIESGRERDSPTRGFYHAVADLDSVGLPAPGTLAAYGSTVKLMHASTGVALHSHAHAYGQAGTSGQQQVTGYAGDDDNDLWRIKGPHGSPASHKAAQPVRHGDVLRLEHVLTQRNLHSDAGHLSPATSQQEVTGFGVRGAGDGNDDWRLEVEGDVAGGGAWDSAKRVRLVHAPTGCALHSHAGWAHPQWTLGQQEVTGFAGRDDNDWWQ
ncbi:MAG: hypothetical protein M3442_18330, partial [Chloroflexota bacterium]|nr:hypothetical protein [Chloroflexota bacterium]